MYNKSFWGKTKIPAGQISYKRIPASAGLCGAGGGGRTRTSVTPTDFESVTSANSITPANE